MPPRAFFWNILYTIKPNFTDNLLKKCLAERSNQMVQLAGKGQAIQMKQDILNIFKSFSEVIGKFFSIIV